MEFRLLKTFDVVSTMMNFRLAAQVLHCTQSTVSAQIKLLEDDLGTPVFERLGRRIALTAAGEELRRHTRRLLSYEREIRSGIRARGETVGLISLRAPQSVADVHLPAILQRFSSACPRVGLDVSNCGFFQLPEELRSGALDAGFLLTMVIDSADLHTRAVLSEPMAYVTHPSSNLAGRSKLTVEDLAGQTLLVAKHDCAYRMKLEQALRESRVEPKAVVELNSLRALIRCLQVGLGVALLPRRAVEDELALGRLVQLDWHEPLATDLFFLRHRDKPLTGAFGAFVAIVEEHFAELRARQQAQAPRGRKRTCGVRSRRAAG
ncbi:MAG: LysR family transcriptional regulator [Myxococcales bacterium]